MGKCVTPGVPAKASAAVIAARARTPQATPAGDQTPGETYSLLLFTNK